MAGQFYLQPGETAAGFTRSQERLAYLTGLAIGEQPARAAIGEGGDAVPDCRVLLGRHIHARYAQVLTEQEHGLGSGLEEGLEELFAMAQVFLGIAQPAYLQGLAQAKDDQEQAQAEQRELILDIL